MKIEITLNEDEAGNIGIQMETHSFASNKEAFFAQCIAEAVKIACDTAAKQINGATEVKKHNVIITPVGRG